MQSKVSVCVHMKERGWARWSTSEAASWQSLTNWNQLCHCNHCLQGNLSLHTLNSHMVIRNHNARKGMNDNDLCVVNKCKAK